MTALMAVDLTASAIAAPETGKVDRVSERNNVEVYETKHIGMKRLHLILDAEDESKCFPKEKFLNHRSMGFAAR